MTLMSGYSTLDKLGPVITTAEAAAALRRDSSATTRLLRSLEEAGRARRIRHGVWAIGPDEPDPFSLVDEITRPFPSYVSFLSALNFHGMIDQIPREIEVASLDRAQHVETSVGSFAIHHLADELFGGWKRDSSRTRGRAGQGDIRHRLRERHNRGPTATCPRDRATDRLRSERCRQMGF